jgi:hypothetical protein
MTMLEMLGKNLSPRGPGDGAESVYLDLPRVRLPKGLTKRWSERRPALSPCAE